MAARYRRTSRPGIFAWDNSWSKGLESPRRRYLSRTKSVTAAESKPPGCLINRRASVPHAVSGGSGVSSSIVNPRASGAGMRNWGDASPAFRLTGLSACWQFCASCRKRDNISFGISPQSSPSFRSTILGAGLRRQTCQSWCRRHWRGRLRTSILRVAASVVAKCRLAKVQDTFGLDHDIRIDAQSTRRMSGSVSEHTGYAAGWLVPHGILFQIEAIAGRRPVDPFVVVAVIHRLGDPF